MVLCDYDGNATLGEDIPDRRHSSYFTTKHLKRAQANDISIDHIAMIEDL